MVIETLVDMLYYPGSHTLKEFSCPEDLKRKIILLTKPPKEYLDSRKTPSSREVYPYLYLYLSKGKGSIWAG